MGKIRKLLGISQQVTTHKEKFVSFLGGIVSIYCVYMVTELFLGIDDAIYIIPSMGASAVLLFAAPNVAFSQPWNVLGGHILSAVIGVTCYQYISDVHFAAAASVGLAIWVQYYARCLHPPGGATAIAAVIGSAQIHDLGYMYVITPVLVNTMVMIVVAIIVNGLITWRYYPASLAPKNLRTTDNEYYSPINHEDFVYALSQIDTMVDISEDDLVKIYYIATKHNEETQ